MKIPISLFPIITGLLLLQLPQCINGQNAQPYLKDSIYSAILQEPRELHIILPNGYQPGSAQRYEVLYILDGEWYQQLVPFTYNFAESAGYLPSSIFVLIRNRYRDGRNLRDRDFSPTRISADTMSGGADRFYDFLTKEVVPYIEQKYPVVSDPCWEVRLAVCPVSSRFSKTLLSFNLILPRIRISILISTT